MMNINILFSSLFLASFLPSMFTYLDIEFQSCEQTIGQENFADFGLKIKRVNKTTRGFFGTVVMRVTADDSFQASAQLWKKQGGEYRKLPYNFPPGNLCESLAKDIYVFPELAQVSNIEYPVPCPMEPRNITVDGFVPTLSGLKPLMNLMSSGDYLLYAHVLKDGEIVQEVKFFVGLINI